MAYAAMARVGRTATARNLTLLAFSLLFYAWGEGPYVAVMLGSILVNWGIGRFLAPSGEDNRNNRDRKRWLWVGVALNLGLLLLFKYTNFFVDSAATLVGWFGDTKPTWNHAIGAVHLPIGVSFFTFQAISYLVDVYRQEAPGEESVPGGAIHFAVPPADRWPDCALRRCGQANRGARVLVGKGFLGYRAVCHRSIEENPACEHPGRGCRSRFW